MVVVMKRILENSMLSTHQASCRLVVGYALPSNFLKDTSPINGGSERKDKENSSSG